MLVQDKPSFTQTPSNKWWKDIAHVTSKTRSPMSLPKYWLFTIACVNSLLNHNLLYHVILMVYFIRLTSNSLLLYDAFDIVVSALQPLKPHAEVVLVTTLRCRYQNSLGKISLSFTITNNKTFKLMWHQYAVTIILSSLRTHGCKGWCAIYMHNWLLLIISSNEAKIKPLHIFS